jgi:hypothetical protein
MNRRAELLLAGLIYAAALGVFFSPIIRHNATFTNVQSYQQASFPWSKSQPTQYLSVQGDQALSSFPRDVLIRRSLVANHQLALWDPLSFAGHPFLADSDSGAAYPPRLVLSAIFSPSAAQDASIILSLFVAALGMFALLKTFKSGFAGALLAGGVWAFCGYSLVWAQYDNYRAVGAFLPLVLCSLRLWHERRSWVRLSAGGLAYGLMLLGSSGEVWLIASLVVVGYAFSLMLPRLRAYWRRSDAVGRLQLLAEPILIPAAGLGVAAVAVLPFLELSSRLGRAPLSYSQWVGASRVHPTDYLHTFLPAATPPGLHGLFSQVFVGTAAALLAIYGLFLRRPGSGLGRGLVITMFLFPIGTPLTWLGYHFVPKLSSLLYLGRSLFVWSLGVAVLAGIGLDSLVNRIRNSGSVSLDGATSGRRLRRARYPRARTVAAVVAAAAILSTGVQLLIYGRNADPPFQPRTASALYPTTPAISAIRSELRRTPGGGRLLVLQPAPIKVPATPRTPTNCLLYLAGYPCGFVYRYAFPGATNLALDLPTAGGYTNVLPDDTVTLWRVVQGEAVSTVLTHPLAGALATNFFLPTTSGDLVQRVGVTVVYAPPGLSFGTSGPTSSLGRILQPVYTGKDGTVLRVIGATPRAFVVPRAVALSSRTGTLRRFASVDFNIDKTVLLEGSSTRAPASSKSTSSAGQPSAIRWHRNDPTSLQLSVTSPHPGWLVLLDSWDPGWTATVNGHSAEIRQADFNFRAVRVDAGVSRVTFSYTPPGFVLGAWISGLLTAFFLGVLAVAAIRARRHRPIEIASVAT